MSDLSDRHNLLRFTSAGIEFIAIFGLMLAGGMWLDSRYDTSPGYALTGAVWGFAGGLYRLIRQAKVVQRDYRHSQDNETSDETPP